MSTVVVPTVQGPSHAEVVHARARLDYHHRAQPVLSKGRKRCRTYVWLRPGTIMAFLAVSWRTVVAPMLLATFMITTNYTTTGTMLIGPDEAYFAFSYMDAVMTGACNTCDLGCARVFAILDGFNHEALLSRPSYEELFTRTSKMKADGSIETILTPEAVLLATELDRGGKDSYCFSGVSEWGAPILAIHGSSAQILAVIRLLNLSVASRHILELERGIADHSSECFNARWDLQGFLHAYTLVPSPNITAAGKSAVMSAAALNVFPEYTACRPSVSNGEIGLVEQSKLANDTQGQDLRDLIPLNLHTIPYWFTERSVEVPASGYGGSDVVTQTYFQAFYGRCRVRAVNSTGVFVDAGCNIDVHWAKYGLMLLRPDDIPVCSTDDICVHSNYNPLWEYVTGPIEEGGDSSQLGSRRFFIAANVFRSRNADKATLSILPSVVVIQVLAMGVLGLYQTMGKRQSVLLTQIWAYRCQSGLQQVVYLVQVAYHLAVTSDLYYLGLTTGTLTLESIGNLTFCFFIFSYTLINLIRARSGDQQLDRYFRLTWEIVQLMTTGSVAVVLYMCRLTSLNFIMEYNGELLRKTMARGAKLCNLSDSCIVFSVNVVVILTVVVAALGLVPLLVAIVLRWCLGKHHTQVSIDGLDDVGLTTNGRRWSSPLMHYHGVLPGGNIKHNSSTGAANRVGQVGAYEASGGSGAHGGIVVENDGSRTPSARTTFRAKSRCLTTFEHHCLGTHFTALFHDCEDFAYVTRRGTRYSSVEAVLLSGYLFYGAHLYRAPDVLLVLMARLLPDRLLRSFNVILIRWRVDPKHRTVSHAMACTWLMASSERGKLGRVAPLR